MEISINSIPQILNILLISSGIGLPVAELIYNLVKGKHKLFITEWVNSSVRILRTGGIFYLITLMLSYLSTLDKAIDQEYESYSILNRIFGPSWFFFWIPVICISLIPQLLWFTSIKKSRFFRILISIILYLGGTEKLNFFITFFDRDYLPSSWSYSFQHNLTEIMVMVLIYSIVTLTDLFVVRKNRIGLKKQS